MARKFLIDTDTASDDAVALLMALRAPDIDVLAITVVAGNVDVDQGVRNALYTSQLAGKPVPVYCGAEKPLLRHYENAHWFHGKDGMGDMNYPPADRPAETQHGVDALIATIKANPGIEVITLGPLTNLALAVSRAPEIVPLVSRCVVMGGNACAVGNVTPAAEYNVWVDPEAAQIVFHSGLPIEMVGWEISRGDALIHTHELDVIRAFHTPLADFALDCNRRAIQAAREQTGETGLDLPDPVAMAVALDPSIATLKAHYVQVETQSDLTRGMTVVDQLNVTHDPRNRVSWEQVRSKAPNVKVCWAIDVVKWKDMLYRTLR
jgi:purine nucleosidase